MEALGRLCIPSVGGGHPRHQWRKEAQAFVMKVPMVGKDSQGRLEEKGLNLRRKLQPLGQCGFSRVLFESYLQR